MADDINPLNEEHLRQLNDGLAGIARARAQLRLAEAAGINVDVSKKEVDELEASLLRIKQVYFPGR